MFDLRLMMFKKNWLRQRCALSTSSILHRTSHIPIPRGISLIEILISMFVMLFGLMGVAAIFPVGNHYVVEGEKFDLGAAIAQNAFEELGARGMLQPGEWAIPPFAPFISNGNFFSVVNHGHALIIDPLGVGIANSSGVTGHEYFPYQGTNPTNPWRPGLVGINWPVRRLTLDVDPTPPPAFPVMMTSEVAETIFRLRDDLAVEQPDESDVPSIQRWDVDGAGVLLRRQYKGDYSWLATIVPTTGEALAALQPAHEAYGEINYDVSVVVFRKRDTTPSEESERLIEAELLQGGELVIYSTSGSLAKQEVDDAVEDIRPGSWISVMGVNQTTGDFLMKWYRILSLDQETTENENVSTVTGQFPLRRAMLIGPDWPTNSMTDLRAAILPGAFLVVTKQMKMEGSSLWSLE